MNSNRIVVSLVLLLISIESLAIDNAACLGRGIYFFQSAMDFTIGKYEERGTQYPAYALKELSPPDLDDDGVQDAIFAIAYDKRTRFSPDVVVVDLLSKDVVLNSGGVHFLDTLPNRKTYAYAIRLSSRPDRFYVLRNSTYFPMVGRKKVALGVNYFRKNSKEWSEFVESIKEKFPHKWTAAGDYFQIAGCLPSADVCNEVVAVFWDGERFRSVDIGVVGD